MPLQLEIGDVVTFFLPAFPVVGKLTGIVEDIDNYPKIKVKVTKGNVIGCTFIIDASICTVH